MTNLDITNVPISDLVPYARNSRTHDDAQVAQIAASIKEFGWTNPVLIDSEQGIIAGHGRVLAARKLGIDQVPCIRLDHLTEAQRRAYVIADNKLALNSGWDEELLKIEIDELRAIDFDIDLLGFNDDELGLLNNGNNADNETLPKQEALKSVFEVAVECENENQQQTVFDLLNKEGYKCRILTM